MLNFKLCPHPYRCDQCPLGVALQIPGEVREKWDRIGPHFLETGSRLQELARILLVPGPVYLANHLWLRIEEEASVSVGLDPFGKYLLGRPKRLEAEADWPPRARWRLRLVTEAGQFELALPTGGDVEPVGGGSDLFSGDWYRSWSPLIRFRFREFVLRPGAWYAGATVADWLVGEIAELERRLVEAYCATAPGRLSTAADGGAPCFPPLHELHGEEWFGRLAGEFVAERNRLVD
ncbi:MAG: hypothetical protein Kow00109_15670 [Acidobacteriota bacterium]